MFDDLFPDQNSSCLINTTLYISTPDVNFTRICFNIMVLAICTRAGHAVFKITVCTTLTVTAMFMTITVGKKSVATTLKAEDIFLVKLRWNLRSGNLGLSTPVDGDGGTDGKVGDNHDTGVEEDEGLGCNL